MATEFDLITRYFKRPVQSAVLGVGDDGALVRPAADMSLVMTTDMLLENRHFLPQCDAGNLGHKSLAVNLSDLAAMGATPRWVLLALALPRADEAWVARFADGFFALADQHEVELVGGDTTRGPLAISITALGEVPPAWALRRDGAQAGDDIWLSGRTGEAALGLAQLQGRVQLEAALFAACVARLERPEPRVELGQRLRGWAHSAIDVSDGLLADLGHIASASGLGADIALDSIPLAPALAHCPDGSLARQCLLSGGDDYELVFTAPPSRRAELDRLAGELGLALTVIGRMVTGAAQVCLRDAQGNLIDVPHRGYDHFA